MNAQRIVVGKPLGKHSLSVLKGDGMITLRWMLSCHVVKMVDGWNCLRIA
jgi:hypothetical protein